MVIPSNMKTYKKIIKGVDYQEIGSVKLYDGKRCIGEIGAKSDLMWSVFYDYFINIGKWPAPPRTVHLQAAATSSSLSPR